MNKVWNLSLGASIVIHLFIFGGLPNSSSPKIEKQKSREIKIFPQDLEKIRSPKETTTILNKLPPYIKNMAKKSFIEAKKNFFMEKPRLNSPTKEIILNEINRNKGVKKNFSYMNYYKLIREKIRKNAYSYYTSKKRGTVYLSFVILNDGSLNNLDLMDDSTPSQNLITIAFQSIKKAAPFPPFPQELHYSQLHFNVSIHFKNN